MWDGNVADVDTIAETEAARIAVLDELAEVQGVVVDTTGRRDTALERRLAVVERGLGLGLTLREMADHITVPAGTLGQARHKERLRAAASA